MSLEEHNGEREAGTLLAAVAFFSFLAETIRDAAAFGQALAKQEGVQSAAVKDQIPHLLEAEPGIAKRRAIEPEIAKRRAIVRQSPNIKSRQLCQRFDSERVPLPSDWYAKYGVNDWKAAYVNPKSRRLVQTLISKDKRLAA